MVLDDVKYRIVTSPDGRVNIPKDVTKEAFDALVDSCDRKGTPYNLYTHVKYEARGSLVYKCQTIEFSF